MTKLIWDQKALGAENMDLKKESDPSEKSDNKHLMTGPEKMAQTISFAPDSRYRIIFFLPFSTGFHLAMFPHTQSKQLRLALASFSPK